MAPRYLGGADAGADAGVPSNQHVHVCRAGGVRSGAPTTPAQPAAVATQLWRVADCAALVIYAMGARQVMREMRRGAALMHPAEEQGSHQLSTSAGAAGAGAAGWERALITPIEADFFQRHTHYVEIMVPHADTGEISCAWCLRGCVIGVPAVLPMMIASHRVVWGGATVLTPDRPWCRRAAGCLPATALASGDTQRLRTRRVPGHARRRRRRRRRRCAPTSHAGPPCSSCH
jgi:hypothetical protein